MAPESAKEDWSIEEPPLLKVREVAESLRVWPDTVRQWLQQGKLRGVKLPGGDWRIRPEDLDDLLERVPSGAE